MPELFEGNDFIRIDIERVTSRKQKNRFVSCCEE